MKKKIILFTLFYLVFTNILYCKLIAEYRMDECSVSGINGEVIDSSGNNYNGTAINGVKVVDGKICRCFEFSGKDEYIDLNHSFSWKRNNSFTITLWFRLKKAFSFKPIVLIGKKNFEYALIYEKGKIFFEYKDKRGFYSILVVAKSIIRRNQWYFIAVAYNGDTKDIELYINGKKDNWITFNNKARDFLITTETTKIGFSSFIFPLRRRFLRNNTLFNIDEVKIFNKALNNNELKSIYEYENSGKNWDGTNRICEICNVITNPYFIEITDYNQDNKAIACEPELICFAVKDRFNRIIKRYSGEIKINSFVGSVEKGNWFKFYSDFTNPDPPKGDLINQGNSEVYYKIRKNDQGKFCIFLENKDVKQNKEKIKIVAKILDSAKDNEYYVDYYKAGFKIFWSNASIEPWEKQISCLSSRNNPKAKSTIYIEAVTSNSNGVCEKIFRGNKNIKARIVYVNPDNKNINEYSPLYINSKEIGYHTDDPNTWNNLILNFINGKAKLNIEYKNAGKLRIEFAYDLDKNFPGYEILTFNSNNVITFSPFALYVYFRNIDSKNSDNIDLFSTKLKAGEDNFTINVEGVCYDPNDDKNKDGIPDKDVNLSDNQRPLKNFKTDIKIIWNVSNPVDGSGVLSSEVINEKSFVNGIGIGKFTFSNTGILKINYLEAENYLDKGNNVIGWPIEKYIGLFIPHHYRIGKVVDGILLEHCGGFSFVGKVISYLQAPYFEIFAENKNNEITTNYGEKFFNIKPEDIIIEDPTNDENFKNLKINIKRDAGSFILFEKGKVVYKFGDDRILYIKDNNSKISPFSPMFLFKIEKIQDSNGIEAINLPTVVKVKGNLMKYCRLKVIDNYGPETENLIMNVVSQYWDNLWKINTDDSCTNMNSTDFVLNNFTGKVTPDNVKILNVEGINNGTGQIVLSAPGYNNYGSVDVDLCPISSKYSYLNDENSKGKANFGIYRGRDRVIMWEEIPAE